MKKYTLVVIAFLMVLTNMAQEKKFDEIALEEAFISTEGEKIQFKQILERYEGNTLFIDIWASWCSDCVKSIPALKKLQQTEDNLIYIMLSLDKEEDAWKDGIKKLELKGQHYMFTSKWKQSTFCKTIDLDWIPRYMIVDKKGNIKMFKAITIDDSKIAQAIKRIEKEKSPKRNSLKLSN